MVHETFLLAFWNAEFLGLSELGLKERALENNITQLLNDFDRQAPDGTVYSRRCNS